MNEDYLCAQQESCLFQFSPKSQIAKYIHFVLLTDTDLGVTIFKTGSVFKVTKRI